jgi:hypothetical protein
MINKLTIPKSTLYRAFKYTKKGYTICTGELKKITDAIENAAVLNVSDDIKPETEINNTSFDFIGFD